MRVVLLWPFNWSSAKDYRSYLLRFDIACGRGMSIGNERMINRRLRCRWKCYDDGGDGDGRCCAWQARSLGGRKQSLGLVAAILI